jgi:sulfate transport system permease protein
VPIASYKLTIGASLAASLVNVVFGLLVAWVLVRYTFPGRSIVDAIVDLPFALPTAVGGIALTAAYSENGWIGQYLSQYGIKAAFSPLGIVIALIFIGCLSWCARCSPCCKSWTLPSKKPPRRWAPTAGKRFSCDFPHVLPAVLTGFALAFARALGEYGSVVFISGQHADAHRNHAAAHHHQAGAIRLRRRDRHRRL